jgi:uncharacterized zinc-type alcohol dehydrogenase-like protein
LGTGCLVDSCGLVACQEGLEQVCLNGRTGTYNALEQDGKTPTYGGIQIQCCSSRFYHIKLSLAAVAPCVCRNHNIFSIKTLEELERTQVLLGLGGLGHISLVLLWC